MNHTESEISREGSRTTCHSADVFPPRPLFGAFMSEMKLSEYLERVGKPVAYFPAMACALGGDVNTAVYLCQFVFWEGKERDHRGVYKTKAEVTKETGLSEKRQDRCRENLERLGVITCTLDRLNHKMFYKLHKDKLNELWSDNPQCWSLDSNTNTDFGNAPLVGSGTTERDVRHIDAENTPDNKTKSLHGTFPELFSIPSFTETWAEFLKHRKAKRCPATRHTQEIILSTLSLHENKAVAALNHAMERGWTTVKWEWLGKESGFVVNERKPTPERKPQINLNGYLQWLDSQEWGDRMRQEWRSLETAPQNLLDDFIENEKKI